jgi:hypothetical protein
MYVTGTATALPAGATEPGLVFLGGYNMHEVSADQPVEGAVKAGLAAMYPAGGGAALRERIGSIDLT